MKIVFYFFEKEKKKIKNISSILSTAYDFIIP